MNFDLETMAENAARLISRKSGDADKRREMARKASECELVLCWDKDRLYDMICERLEWL